MLETALDAGEMVGHLGYEKHDPARRNSENSRNGTRAKTVLTGPGRDRGAAGTASELATVQACVIHLTCNTLRFASASTGTR